MNIIKYKSPFGVITIQEKDGEISHVYLPNAEPTESPLLKGGGGGEAADEGLRVSPHNNVIAGLTRNPPSLVPRDTPFEKGALVRDLLLEAHNQFEQYFNGKRKSFDLPLSFDGCTDFMKSVYRELLKISYGETASYKQIAERVNCPKGFRAVGLANNKNPLPIIVPCHRVIGSDGKLVGFGGGIDLKIKLLELEKNNIKVL